MSRISANADIEKGRITARVPLNVQQTIQKAAELASGNGQQAIEPGHILKAIMSEEENITSFLFKKLNIDQISNLFDILNYLLVHKKLKSTKCHM